MEVDVRYFYILREITGRREEQVEVQEDATVEDLLNLLSKRYGEKFEKYVYSGIKQKGLRIIFLVDGRNILQLDGLRTKLENGHNLTMMPPVAGGEF